MVDEELKSGHRGIDHQEIVDLYLGNETTGNIGWGYRRIANHLECSSQNVRNHIRSENIKREKTGLCPLKEIQKKRIPGKPEKKELIEKIKKAEASIEGESLDEESQKEAEESSEIEFDGEPLEIGTSPDVEYLGPEGSVEEIEEESETKAQEEKPAEITDLSDVEPPKEVIHKDEALVSRTFKLLKSRLEEIGSESPEKDAAFLTDFIFSEECSVSDSLREEYGRSSRKIRSIIIDALGLDLVKTCSNEDFEQAIEAYKKGM